MSVQEQIDRLLAQRAAEWFEIYRTGRTDQHPAFVAWITESPRHLQEFLEIAGRYSAVRDALQGGAIDHEALIRKLAPKITQLRPASASVETSEMAPRPRRRWMPGAAAAAIAAVALGVWALMISPWQTYETEIGEQRVIQLPDGSMLTLNASSRASVQLTESGRTVRLVQGEALFDVAPDKSRPFQVLVHDATLRVLGTQFNVYARPNGNTTVAVLEGRVEVVGGTSAGSKAPVLLKMGEGVQIASTGTVERATNVDLGNATAWRQRRLVFDSTPLEDIVQEFNRYNQKLRLTLSGVPAGSYTFTGSFDADDPRSLGLLLSKEPQLAVEDTGKEIVIRPREPK